MSCGLLLTSSSDLSGSTLNDSTGIVSPVLATMFGHMTRDSELARDIESSGLRKADDVASSACPTQPSVFQPPRDEARAETFHTSFASLRLRVRPRPWKSALDEANGRLQRLALSQAQAFFAPA